MIIDGKQIARQLLAEVQNTVTHCGPVHLTIFTCQPNFETRKYLNLKRRRAAEVGIELSIVEFTAEHTTKDICTSIERATIMTDGIIVQLPLPAEIDTEAVLSSVPKELDVDGIWYNEQQPDHVLPPVVGAIAVIAQQQSLSLMKANVVIVGSGRLVGTPAAVWAREQGASVTVLTKESIDTAEHLATADIIILGAGDPHFLTPDMVTSGVAIFDAGTSEDNGTLRGDADPACAEKSSIFTPVPGGIGPITVALLLQNLVTLRSGRQ